MFTPGYWCSCSHGVVAPLDKKVAYLLCSCVGYDSRTCEIGGAKPVRSGPEALHPGQLVLLSPVPVCGSLLSEGLITNINESRRCCPFPAAGHGVADLAGLLPGRQHILLPPRGRGAAHSSGAWASKRGVWCASVVRCVVAGEGVIFGNSDTTLSTFVWMLRYTWLLWVRCC